MVNLTIEDDFKVKIHRSDGILVSKLPCNRWTYLLLIVHTEPLKNIYFHGLIHSSKKERRIRSTTEILCRLHIFFCLTKIIKHFFENINNNHYY